MARTNRNGRNAMAHGAPHPETPTIEQQAAPRRIGDGKGFAHTAFSDDVWWYEIMSAERTHEANRRLPSLLHDASESAGRDNTRAKGGPNGTE